MGSKWTKYFSWLLITSLFLTAASCGRGGTGTTTAPTPTLTKEPITLEYWRLFHESSALDSFIEEYQREYPNINIEVKKIDLKPGETVYDYQANITKLIADGAGPDIFMINNSWLPYMANQISPMPQGFMSVNGYEDIFPKFVVDDFVQDNRIYAVPYYIDNLMLYYNATIFDEARLKPPKTLQELVDIIPRLTKKDGAGNITQSAIALGADTASVPRAADILSALMMQYGAEMTSADHKTATFNLPSPGSNPPYFSAREALAYYTQFADPDSSNTYTYTDRTDSRGNRILPIDIQGFMEGKVAMFVGYSYHIQNIRNFAPRSLRFDTAPLPQLRLQEPANIANYWGETVSKTSKHANEAWHFIGFMSKRQNLNYLGRVTGTVPSHKDLFETASGATYYGPVASQAAYTKTWYRPNTSQVEAIFSRMINAVVKNNTSVEIAIESAVRDINALTSD